MPNQWLGNGWVVTTSLYPRLQPVKYENFTLDMHEPQHRAFAAAQLEKEVRRLRRHAEQARARRAPRPRAGTRHPAETQ